MGQKFLDEYLAPKMQQPQMPTFSPAVMSGQMTPEQAQASGIPAMPNAPQFSGIDRWLPLINAAAGALSTPGSPTQPLAPLGGAIGGFAQGRLQQIQLERQAAAPYQQVALDMYARQREAAITRQQNENRATELEAQAAALESTDPKRAGELHAYAGVLRANAPDAARFLLPRPESETMVKEREAKTKAAEATATLRTKQAETGATGSTPAERKERASQSNFNKGVGHVTSAYNNDPAVRGNLAAPSRMQWYATENGQRALAEAAAMSGMSEYEFRTKIKAPNAVISPEQKAEYDAAPEGDTFTFPDGHTYKKTAEGPVLAE